MPKTFNDLVALMDRLRSPGGCPWDIEQTYATLAPMLLEEAYEAFDALEEAREGRPAAPGCFGWPGSRVAGMPVLRDHLLSRGVRRYLSAPYRQLHFWFLIS